jgi:hypothetical protein
MRLRLFIALFLSLGSISTAAMLFWDDASKPSSKKTAPQSSVEIKWGEGSEAGVPDAAVHK